MKTEVGAIAILAAILSNVIWGSTFMASKVVLAQCPPVTAVMIRFLIAVSVFAVIAAVRKNDFQVSVIKSRLGALFGLGFLGYSGLYILQMTALKHIASSQSAAIMLLAPVFTLIIESTLKKEARVRETAVIGVGFVGAFAIILEQYKVDFTGVGFQGLLLTVGSAFCLGASVVQTKRLLAPIGQKKGFTVFNLTFLSLLIGAIGLMPFVAAEQLNSGGRIPMTADFWLWSAYLGVVCSVGAFLMWNWAIKHVSAVAVAITMYLKTPVALGIGALLLSEHLTLIFYVGTILILGTLFSNQLSLVRGNTQKQLFQPDLIIEATNACNKACRGCYAPNVIVKDQTEQMGVYNLTASTIEHIWPADVEVTAIRGGEPTLNPNLTEIILAATKRSTKVYLETNGDWISVGHPLLKTIRDSGCIVKLSVDSMHETKKQKLAQDFWFLKEACIPLAVAITEKRGTDIQTSLSLLPSDFSGEVFIQNKATTEADLVQAKAGVITSKGELVKAVTHRFEKKLQHTAIATLSFVILTLGFNTAQAETKKVTVGIAANFSAMSDSTSNPYANYFRNAIEMAFSENRERLKAKGLDVQLKEFDYSDDKLKVIETANSAVQSEAVAIIGYIYSSDVLLAGPIFNKNKLLMLTPTGTADRIEDVGPFVRRTCFNDSYQGKILGDYAYKNKKVKSVAIVSVADCAYCQSLRTAFKQRFEALGGKVASDLTILSSDTSFDKVIETLKQKKVDAIFVPNYERISATLIASLYDAGIQPSLWLGGDGWGNSVDLFYRIVGKRKFKAYTISHWHRDLDTPKSRAFFNEFTKRYGKAPVDTAVLAYDSALMLIQALMNTSTLTREGVLEAIEKIRVFDGVTGKLNYPASSRTPAKPAVLLKLENGQLAVERVIGS